MPEPTAADVAQYTSGRLAEDSPETGRLLSASLRAARRFCGWHVTDVLADDEVTIDGPGSPLLVLPTLRLVELKGIVEEGVELDLETDVYVSARGLVRKRSGVRWSSLYAGIVVTMDHGFEEADDFNAAVLSFVDRSSLTVGGGQPKAVGPFQYNAEAMAPGSAFSVVEKALLDQYRLESAP